MYVPASFQESDPEILFSFIEEHGFATLFSWGLGEPVVSHVPLLVDRSRPGEQRLLGHVARANRHWEAFDGQRAALAIFHGPHAYVSPATQSQPLALPTWNYAVVHVHGRPRTVDSTTTRAIVDRLIDKYEAPRASRWNGDMPPDFLARKLEAIVGFEMAIERMEGKFKLAQNRDRAALEEILAGLDRESDPAARALAAFSRDYLARRDRR